MPPTKSLLAAASPCTSFKEKKYTRSLFLDICYIPPVRSDERAHAQFFIDI